MIKEINEQEFDKEILESDISVVVFEKPQCPHCIKTLAGLETIIDKYADQVAFSRINTLEANNLIDKYQIMAAPTILVFKNGELTKRRSGYTHPLVVEDIIGGLK